MAQEILLELYLIKAISARPDEKYEIDKYFIKCYSMAMGIKDFKFADKLKKMKISRGDVHEYFEKMQGSGPVLGLTVAAAFILMIFVCAVVFFLNVKGPERVMVPQVCGKKLASAIIEMGEKELYPTLATRDVQDPSKDGIILEQNPNPGSIVKGYSRVSLVVGRLCGPDQIEDFVGKNIDEVRNDFLAKFAKLPNAPVTVGLPFYKVSEKPFGTILEQDPKPGTLISDSVELQLIVSKGPEGNSVHPVNFVGKSIDYMNEMMEKCLVIYDFTGHIASENEKPGTGTDQTKFEEWFVPAYTRVKVDVALPGSIVKDGKNSDNRKYGIFEAKTADFPMPVPMVLQAENERNKWVVAKFSHTGSKVTVPYAVEKETVLTLFVAGKPVYSETIN